MRGQSRKRPVRRKRLQKALVLALAGVMVSNSAGVGMLESFADETELTGSLGDNGETGGTETGTGTENGGGNSETGGNNETSGTETGSGNDGASGTETGDGNDGTGETETGDGNDGTITDGEGDGTVTDGGDDGTGTDGEDEGTETDGEGDETVTDGEGDGTETDGGDDGTTTDGGDDGTTTNGGDDGTGTDGEDDGTGTDGEDSDAGTDDESGAVGDSGSVGETGSAGTGGESGTNGTVSTGGTDTEKVSFIIDYYCDEELGTVRGPLRVEKGESLYFTVVPREGAVIVSVTANGMDVAPIVTATGSELKNGTGRQNDVLIDVEEDVEIEVDFAVAGVMAMSAEIPDAGGAVGAGVEYKTMSEYVVPDRESIVYDSKTSNFQMNLNIQENDEDELTVVLDEEMLYCLENYPRYIVPGMYFNWDFQFVNESGNTYRYKDGSLVIAPADMSEGIQDDYEKFGENYPHVRGYDGQLIPSDYSMHRCKDSEALEELFGKSSTKITLEDMVSIYDVLAEKGYTGDQPLTDFYLDYYNEKYGTSAGTIIELPVAAQDDIMARNGGYNGFFKVSGMDEIEYLDQNYEYFNKYAVVNTSKMQVELIEIEPQLATLIYDDWYNICLGMTVGSKLTSKEANAANGFEIAGIGKYMTGLSDIWDQSNDYLNETLYLGEETPIKVLPAGMGFSGPKLGNVNQGYPIDFYVEFTLERVITEGTLTIHKVDDDGNIIAAPATFQLFKMDGDQKLYYTGSDWSTDAAQSAAFVTENGTVTIPGLDLGVYYIQEVQAPEGYELVTEPYQVSLEGETLEVNFSNKIQYTIIVNYYEKDTNTKLADSYVSGTYTRGEAYDVTEQIQKVIEGYNWDSCDSTVYAGTMNGNLIFNVYYTKTPTTDEPDNEPSGGSPSGSGGGGGGSSSGPRNPYNPGGGPGVTIEEDAVPLAPLPENNEAVAINEDNVPLSPLPKTGQEKNAGAWLAMLSGLVTAAYVLLGGKKEREAK